MAGAPTNGTRAHAYRGHDLQSITATGLVGETFGVEKAIRCARHDPTNRLSVIDTTGWHGCLRPPCRSPRVSRRRQAGHASRAEPLPPARPIRSVRRPPTIPRSWVGLLGPPPRRGGLYRQSRRHEASPPAPGGQLQGCRSDRANAAAASLPCWLERAAFALRVGSPRHPRKAGFRTIREVVSPDLGVSQRKTLDLA